MKKNILTAFLIFSGGICVFAQNTFPGTGNVGIGTISPNSLLTLRLGASGMSFNPGTNPYFGTLAFSRESATGQIFDSSGFAYQINNGGPGPNLYFQVYSGDGSMITGNSLVVGSNGNIGIGDSNPNVPLSVFGVSTFFPARIGSGDARSLSISNLIANNTFVSNDYPVILKTGNGDQPLILDAARIGIGTTTPREKLSVNGNIRAKEIKVETANWPDYVFKEDYKLTSLTDLESYIKTNGHLPGIPTAQTVEKEGIAVSETIKAQQKIIEELTLHLIEKEKELKKSNEKINQLDKKVDTILKKLSKKL